MDIKILNKLEFDKIQNKLADMSYFAGGYKRALDMRPSSDYFTVNKSLDETTEAMEALRFRDPGFLSGLQLIDQHLGKARIGGILSPAEFLDIFHILHASRQARKYVQKGKYPTLQKICASMAENIDLEEKIQRAISEEGSIRDDASPELKRIRNQINTSRQRIREYLQAFIRSTDKQKLLQDALITERDGRYVVPVKQEYRYEVKGIVHDESTSGATVFIEPLPVVEHNNQIRGLQAEEKREVERILRELSQLLMIFTEELEINQDILGTLDFIFARARMAYKMNAFRPDVNNSGIVDLNRAKHPLLGENAVPINLQLGIDFDILVVTGPNTGGKTVALKTLGLLTLMAMCGLFVPARENSRISIFDSIFVDIGDEQSIEQSLSTFSSHMKNIIGILDAADKHSLVLMDELGAGTDPVEGAALARVILEELRNRKAKVLVTTHQSELKSFAYQNERVENACVEFNPVSLQPTYELTIGMPGQSNALEIASRLGLKPSMVKRARELVPEREMEVGNMIRKLKESRYHFDESSREIDVIKEELLKEKEMLQREKELFYHERDNTLKKSREEARNYLREIKNEADEALKELKDFLKEKDKPPKWHEVEQKRQRLKKINTGEKLPWDSARNEKENPDQLIKPGDYVYLKSFDQKGYVVKGSDSQDEVLVQVGALKLNVNKDKIRICEAPEPSRHKWQRNQTYLEKARHISKEIDVRGKMSEEALQDIDKYLEDANLVGLDSVRIIHGKGTGALRKAVRYYLQDHNYVKNYRDGQREEGGFGVTVVELR